MEYPEICEQLTVFPLTVVTVHNGLLQLLLTYSSAKQEVDTFASFNVLHSSVLPVVLYGCETWSLVLREKHSLRVLDSRVLSNILGSLRDKLTCNQRKCYNEMLLDWYLSPDIILVI
jgi:hypothetical protein